MRKDRLRAQAQKAEYRKRSIEELKALIEASSDLNERRLMKQVINEKKFAKSSEANNWFRYSGKSRFAKSHDYRKPMSKKYDMPEVDWG